MSIYRVTYEEIGGWIDDLGTIEADSVSDALDIVEERFVSSEYRTNTAGDCWTWSGTDYLASSDTDELDGFGYIGWQENTAEGLDSEADFSWIVRLVR